MQAAVQWQMPIQLRNTFCTLIKENKPINTPQLWEEFYLEMAEDEINKRDLYRHYSRDNIPDDIKAQLETWCFWEIQKILLSEGFDFAAMLANKHFEKPADLPDPAFLLPPNQVQKSRDYRQDIKLNDTQQRIFENFKDSFVSDRFKKVMILDAPGGTGKTFLLKYIQHWLLTQNKRPCIMSWAGIAASLYDGGRTVHNTFSLPLDCTLQCNIHITSKTLEQRLCNYDVFILDEAPMTPRCVLEAINVYLKEAHHNKKELFGGKHMILSGDGRQTSPVLQGASNDTLISISIQKSAILQHVFIYYLTENMRIKGEREKDHREWVLSVGDGEVDNLEDRTVNLPLNLLLRPDETITEHVYPKDFVFHYPPLPDKREDPCNIELDEILAERAILCPTNDVAMQINSSLLERMEGVEFTLESNDSIVTPEKKNEVTEETALRYPVEFLNRQTPTGLPAHTLRLKPGTVLILLRNIRVKDGLCNGTRLRFIELHENKFLLKCRILTGPNAGRVEFIPRMDLDSTSSAGIPFVLRRRQSSVRLAYATTINKSQGQTFKVCGVFLPTQCFAYGQLYVALSRCSTSAGLRVDSYDKDNRRTNRAVNVVLPQLLKYGND
jgi:hypothetical protein